MNIQDSPEQAAFRAEVRGWIANHAPRHLQGQDLGIVQGPGLSAEELAPLEAALVEKGWDAPHWPKAHGGAGFDIPHLVIFYEEWTRAGLPHRHTTGLDMLGPILIAYGNDAQRARFLDKTRRGEIVWAQGYSEPQAGSDLASLSLRADAVEGGFKLNGQKVWTSKAHKAHWIFVLARTDPKPKRKQQGISFLLVDLKSPGVEVRPIQTMDGFVHFCETFFTDVFVPQENLVGDLHQGWGVAKALLGHERFTHPTAHPYVIGTMIDRLKRHAREAPDGEGVAWDDADLRRTVARLEMDVDCLRYTQYRALTKVEREGAPGPEAMLFKLFGAELTQRIVELEQQVAGPEGVVWDETPRGDGPGFTARHGTNIRAATIRGGTNEVQRNVLAKRVLGLPD